jgi:hypothetical protein
MEVMDTSMDKFYPIVYKNGRTISEDILGKVSDGSGASGSKSNVASNHSR